MRASLEHSKIMGNLGFLRSHVVTAPKTCESYSKYGVTRVTNVSLTIYSFYSFQGVFEFHSSSQEACLVRITNRERLTWHHQSGSSCLSTKHQTRFSKQVEGLFHEKYHNIQNREILFYLHSLYLRI